MTGHTRACIARVAKCAVENVRDSEFFEADTVEAFLAAVAVATRTYLEDMETYFGADCTC